MLFTVSCKAWHHWVWWDKLPLNSNETPSLWLLEINIVQTHSLNFQGKEIPIFNVKQKHVLREQTHTRCCIIQTSLCVSTWMRLAAGFLLFSKCFCRCCSCTFRANPDPRMPWNTHTPRHQHTRDPRKDLQELLCGVLLTAGKAKKEIPRRAKPADNNRPVHVCGVLSP